MTRQFEFVAAVALLFQQGGVPDLRTDGHRIAPRETTIRSYDCGSISGAISYEVERIDDPGADAYIRHVTLRGLTVNGRTLAPEEIAGAANLFRRFAEIEGLGSNCTNGFLEIRVWGVTAAELEEETRLGNEAESEVWTIRLSADGIVYIAQ